MTRNAHPYYMYDAIQAEPDTFARLAQANLKAAHDLAGDIALSENLYIVGIGTSQHAAQIGEYLVRAYGGDLPTRAINSFDFALYPPRLAVRDSVIVISHRGTKQYSAEALKQARAAGCTTALITGDGTPDGSADITLHTVAQEKSSAHTISYVGTLALLALIAERIGYHRTGYEGFPEDVLTGRVPAAMRAALATEAQVKELAAAHVGRRRIWLVGGGVGAVTAQEIALKIKESSYLQAEGMSVEAMLHGPFQCVEADDLFVLVAPSGAAQSRILTLAAMVKEIGGACIVVGDSTATVEGATVINVPPVPETFTALTCLLPLQLFTYHLALARGTNPDNFRLEDPRFAAAGALVQL